jgi:hypothetical protein
MLEQAGFSLRDNTALLCVPAPEAVEKIHVAYFEAGSDTSIHQHLFGIPAQAGGKRSHNRRSCCRCRRVRQAGHTPKGGLIGLELSGRWARCFTFGTLIV